MVEKKIVGIGSNPPATTPPPPPPGAGFYDNSNLLPLMRKGQVERSVEQNLKDIENSIQMIRLEMTKHNNVNTNIVTSLVASIEISAIEIMTVLDSEK